MRPVARGEFLSRLEVAEGAQVPVAHIRHLRDHCPDFRAVAILDRVLGELQAVSDLMARKAPADS